MELLFDAIKWIAGLAGVLAVVVGLAAGAATIADYVVSRTVAREETFPVRIRRSIRFRDYAKALDRFALKLDQQRTIPDFVVGIHYGGVACAADVARRWYRPVLHVETFFEKQGDSVICKSVRPTFDLALIKDKRVLLVDNSVKSGATLAMAKAALLSHVGTVETLVVFRRGDRDIPTEITHTLFRSRRNLRDLLR